MISWVTRPPAKIKGENDTWSYSLMSHSFSWKTRPGVRKTPGLFLWLLPIEEADPDENFGLVA